MPEYTVILKCFDTDQQETIKLPFVPYPGLCLSLTWSDEDYEPISEVSYDRHQNIFVCHFH